MGRCWRCQTELRLAEDEYICDNCNEIMGYRCHSCKQEFSVRNPITMKRREECSICKDFYCPHCGVCAADCSKIEWANRIKIILNGQLTLDGKIVVDNYYEKIKNITSLIEEIKKEKIDKKVCKFGVFQSYARGGKDKGGCIKRLLAKMNGIGVRDELDAEKFKEKFTQILNLEEGKKYPIEEIRANGRHGQEEREAANMGVCMGHMRTHFGKNKKGKTYLLYEKIAPCGKCEHLRKDNFIKKRCSKCNIDYANKNMPKYYKPNLTYCPKCRYEKNTKKHIKGEQVKLIEKETNTFICNLPYKEFRTVIMEESNENSEEGN